MKRVETLSQHLTAAGTPVAGSREPQQSFHDELRSLRLEPNRVRELVQRDAPFDVKALQRWIEHDNHAMRAEFREFLKDPLFTERYHMTLEEERKLATDRLRKVTEKPGRFISVHDFATNPNRIFAVHELACLVDGSMATKITVNFNLGGGTVSFVTDVVGCAVFLFFPPSFLSFPGKSRTAYPTTRNALDYIDTHPRNTDIQTRH